MMMMIIVVVVIIMCCVYYHETKPSCDRTSHSSGTKRNMNVAGQGSLVPNNVKTLDTVD